MVSGGRAVFKYVLEIKDMLTKGRQVVQMNNQITGSTQKASVATDKYSSSVQGAGRSSAAAAVNFQTMTQGMLNLSTAGIQTFTSISNLDRAGNRLAMSQIAVARAQDLLNNKQLRLNELMEKGGAGTQKATNLTNELATARADLLVKTDKLKIEEGALFDIQLLFVANIANVMISSIQTITTLRTLDIAATIKQTISQKLHNAGILTTTKSYPFLNAAVRQNTLATNTATNANRLLTLSLPVVGIALVAVTLLWEAYTENLGGFRDMVQKLLPMMKDQKKLLRDVQDELNGTNGAAGEFNDTLGEQVKLTFKLPDNYLQISRGLERMKKDYSSTAKEVNNLNKEISNTPSGFSLASPQGGINQQIRTQNGSNVIQHEGDTRFTPNAVNMNSIIAGSAASFTGFVPRTTETISQAGNVVRIDSNGNKFVTSKQSNSAKAFVDKQVIEQTINIASNVIGHIIRGAGQASTVFQDSSGAISHPQILSTPSGRAFLNQLGEFAAQYAGLDSVDEHESSEKTRKLLLELSKTNKGFDPTSKFSVDRAIYPLLPPAGGGSFVGAGAFFDTSNKIGLGGITLDGVELTTLGSLSGGTQALQQLKKQVATSNTLTDEQRSEIQQQITKFETDPEAINKLLLQDIFLGRTITGQILNVEDQKKAREKAEALKIKLLTQRLNQQITQIEIDNLVDLAASYGLSSGEFQKRQALGAVGGRQADIAAGVSNRLPDLDTIKGVLARGLSGTGTSRFTGQSINGALVNTPLGVSEALAIRRNQEQGIGLRTDTNFDRLIKASFGTTSRFGSGLVLSKDDPLLRSSAGMGPIQGQVFRETGVNIGGVAESIGFGQSKELAKVQGLMEQFKNTAGGNADSAISILNHISANNAFGQRADLNDLLSGKHSYADIAAGRIMRGNANGTGIGRTDFFGTGFFNSTGASGAAQVAPGSIKVPAWVAQQRAIYTSNINKLRNGGTRVTGSDGAYLALSVQGAISGGFKTISAFRSNAQQQIWEQSTLAVANLGAAFGFATPSFGGRKGNSNSLRTAATNRSNAYSASLASAGLKLSQLSSPGSLGQNFDYAGWRASRMPAIQAHNRSQLARAGQINLLMGGFGLESFFGSGLSGDNLAIEIQAQDAKIASIGLNRTEAFKIIDIQGRGRAEIDDRVLWTQRNSSISTGVAVI